MLALRIVRVRVDRKLTECVRDSSRSYTSLGLRLGRRTILIGCCWCLTETGLLPGLMRRGLDRSTR